MVQQNEEDTTQPEFDAEEGGLIEFYFRRRLSVLLTVPLFIYFAFLISLHVLFSLLVLYSNFGKIFFLEDYWAWLGVLAVGAPGLICWYTLKYLKHVWDNLKNTRGQKVLMSFGLLSVATFAYNLAFVISNPLEREPIKHALMGPVFLAMGEKSLAVSEFKGIWTESLGLAAHKASGTHFAARGNWERAAREFERALELDPKSGHLHWLLGAAYYSLERQDDALREYRKAVELDPNLFEAHTAIGNIFFENEDYDRALEAYKRAIQSFPPGKKTTVEFANYRQEVSLAKYYVSIAQIYVAQGQLSEAIDALEKAKSFDENDPDVLLNLGDAYEKAGSNKAAIEAFEKFLALARNDPERKEAVEYAELEIELLKVLERTK